MKILVIDVGGTHVKVLASGRKQRVEFPSGPKMTPAKMTTVFVRQGYYARDTKLSASQSPADLTIKRIGELLNFNLDQFHPHPAGRTRSNS